MSWIADRSLLLLLIYLFLDQIFDIWHLNLFRFWFVWLYITSIVLGQIQPLRLDILLRTTWMVAFWTQIWWLTPFDSLDRYWVSRINSLRLCVLKHYKKGWLDLVWIFGRIKGSLTSLLGLQTQVNIMWLIVDYCVP